jgi:hypothetical protein
MSASADPTQSPEWELARKDWWTQAGTQLAGVQTAVNAASPGSLPL